jgi:predicted transcriptional regulator
MSKTSVVTARLDPETLAALDLLGERQDRSRAWLVGQAIKRYVEEEAAFLAFLKEGEDAIERGDYVAHDDLIAELKAMRKEKRAA